MTVAAHARALLAGEERPSAAWDDGALVAACRDGDDRAWNALLAKYKRYIYSIAFRYHATPEDAADIFQSVCVELVSTLDRLREPAALRGWLATVTAHNALRWRRRQVRRDEVERTEEDLAEMAGATNGDDRARDAIERAQDLREALAKIPERCQAMIGMLFFEEPPRPYAEVAASLGLATGSIGFIRGRCLDKLKKVLAERADGGRGGRD